MQVTHPAASNHPDRAGGYILSSSWITYHDESGEKHPELR